jgi:hypothetical protein
MNLNESVALSLAKKAVDGINSVQKQLNTVLKQNLDVLPSADDEWDIGADDNRYKDLYLSGNADITGGLTVNGLDSQPVRLTTTSNGANAIYLHANGGVSEKIKIHADRGTSAEDRDASIQLLSDVGGINLYSGMNNANSIYIHANGGTTETIKIHADIGTGATSINILSDAGGITLNASSAVAISNNATVGGTFDVDGTTTLNQVTIDTTDGDFAVSGGNKIYLETTKNAADAIYIHTSGSTGEAIKIHSEIGVGAASINILSNDGGITLNAYKAVAITNNATVGGTFDVDGATTLDQVTIDTSDGDFAVSGSNAITLETTKNAANAIYIHTDGGTLETIKILAHNGDTDEAINIISSAGGITLDAYKTVAVVGAFDVNGATTLDQVTIDTTDGDFAVSGSNAITLETTKNAADAIYIHAHVNGGTAQTIKIHSEDGTNNDAVNIISSVGGITLSASGTVTMATAGPNVGSGFQNGGSGAQIARWIPMGSRGVIGASYVKTWQFLLDLRGLSAGSTDGDIIGINISGEPVGTEYAHFGQYTTSVLGYLFWVTIECLETPAGGGGVIKIFCAEENNGAEDQPISDLTATELLDHGSWTAGDKSMLATMPTANHYFYLVGNSGGLYSAGRFLMTFYGTP